MTDGTPGDRGEGPRRQHGPAGDDPSGRPLGPGVGRGPRGLRIGIGTVMVWVAILAVGMWLGRGSRGLLVGYFLLALPTTARTTLVLASRKADGLPTTGADRAEAAFLSFRACMLIPLAVFAALVLTGACLTYVIPVADRAWGGRPLVLLVGVAAVMGAAYRSVKVLWPWRPNR